MKAFEENATNELIEFYESYIQNATKKELREKAGEVYGKYLGASPLLSKTVNVAVSKLVDFLEDTGIEPPTKAQAKEIVARLRKKNIEK